MSFIIQGYKLAFELTLEISVGMYEGVWNLEGFSRIAPTLSINFVIFLRFIQFFKKISKLFRFLLFVYVLRTAFQPGEK